MTTLVTGATGRIGSDVVAMLGEANAELRRAVRKPSAPGEVMFDWTAPETWPNALEAAEQAFVMTPESMGDVGDPVCAFLDAAQAAGVQRIVLLSAHGADKDDHGTGMGRIEARVQQAFDSWCIFRPNTFMQNFSSGPFLPSILQNGAVAAPVGEARVSFIDLHDIAACVAAALRDTSVHDIKTLTGPEALSFGEVAETLSEVTGQPIAFVDMAEADMAGILAGSGMPPPVVDMILGFYATLKSGDHALLTDTVEMLAGRAAKSFKEFAQHNKAAWAR